MLPVGWVTSLLTSRIQGGYTKNAVLYMAFKRQGMGEINILKAKILNHINGNFLVPRCTFI